MEITCDQCQSRFRIPDEKLPAGQVSSFACPKCKNKISVEAPQTEEQPKKGAKKAASPNGFSDAAYDASEKPFDFVEEEGKTALVCESDPEIRKKIIDDLGFLEYHITAAETSRDALKKMRYHIYDLVVVNEIFDTNSPDSNGVLIYLERLNIDIRRNIFVALMSQKYRTMDNMMAFRYSVNIVINVKKIDKFASILNSGIADNELFYRVYKESLKAAGRG